MTKHSYQGVALVSPVSFGYARYSERSAAWFIGRALAQLIHAAGIDKVDIDGLAISSFSLAPDSVISLTESFGLTPQWLEHLPFGGSSGVIALRRAARAIQAGDAEIIACIGGDTATPGGFSDLVENFSGFSKDAVYPYGAAGPNGVFALITQHYMNSYGVKREDFGKLCVAQRYNAQHFPLALLGDKPLTLDTYLSARPIAEPLHLFDCVMPCAGSEGFLMMNVERASALNLEYVEILAAEERHNTFAEDAVQIRGGWELYADRLYDAAGLGPDEIDLVQTYDDYPVIALLQLEGLGFFPKGEAHQFLQTTDLTFDGKGLPHNTSGGQLSVGQAGSAAGFMGVVETLRQLTDSTLGQAVANARVGVVSGYGMVNYDRGLCSSAAILARGAK